MPQGTTKQFHIHDFTADELNPFLATALKNVKHAMLVPGEGRVREQTTQRVRKIVRDTKAGSVAALPPSDQPSGLHVSLPVDKKTLDDWLRKEIPDLPPIGKYVAVQPPRDHDPDVALRVRWEE